MSLASVWKLAKVTCPFASAGSGPTGVLNDSIEIVAALFCDAGARLSYFLDD